jgi:hypothetical protein
MIRAVARAVNFFIWFFSRGDENLAKNMNLAKMERKFGKK